MSADLPILVQQQEVKMMFFFIADTHFGHENVIRFCNRPFSSADAMNEQMIRNWNARVHRDDTVFIVGDMFFRTDEVEKILTQLKGRKRLILGNHDGSVRCIRLGAHSSQEYFINHLTFQPFRVIDTLPQGKGGIAHDDDQRNPEAG